MKNKYYILVEGYAGEKNNSFFASPTSTLIISNGKKVLVDPGADIEALKKGFKKFDLKMDEVDLIYLTHYHPDHFLNIKYFPQVDILDSEVLWKTTGEEIFPDSSLIEGTDIEIIKTPGHSAEHSSLLFETEDEGIVCVAQDVFWWKNGEQPKDPILEELLSLEDEFASDPIMLQQSRIQILEIADIIIPGHGKKFQNKFKDQLS